MSPSPVFASSAFGGSGIFGYRTRNLKVSDVVAINDAAYGIASFEGIGTEFTGNSVIVLAGSQHNAIVHNDVTGNRGDTLFSGGIVLIATPRARQDGSFDASSNNLVLLNTLRGNRPANIVQDAASSPNLIAGNRD